MASSGGLRRMVVECDNILFSNTKYQKRYLILGLTFAVIMVTLLSVPECQAVTLTITANNGSVTVNPVKADYNIGEIVELRPKPDTGYYFTGWTGDAQGRRLVINLKMDSNKSIVANFDTWQPPIGIPAPSFGIEETHLMYKGQMYDFGSGPEPYKDAGNGPYTHYVDNTHPSATETDNPYGTAAKPRTTIPRNLVAGSVVEVHGGPYSYTDRIIIVVNGTADMPIFIRGEESRSELKIEIILMGKYAILENLYMNNSNINIRILSQLWNQPSHDHLSIRNFEIEGGGVHLYDNSDYMVIYNSHIHHHGDAYAPTDDDLCGVAAGYGGINYLWVVDNHIHHNGGDSVAGGHTAAQTTTHIYVGRNEMHGDGENAVDFKDVTDVIVSQNTMYDYPIRNPSSNGVITVTHEGYSEPESSRGTIRAWFLFNEMYDAEDSANRSADTKDIYFIGNNIYDIQGKAFFSWDHEDIYYVGNTMYNMDDGIIIAHGYGGTATIVNNIFGSLSDPGGDHIDLSANYLDNAVVSNNLFQDPMNVNTVSVNYIEADPQFVDAENNDFHLQSTSPAIDAGTSSGAVQQVFDRFEQLYGIDIRQDIEGTPRPQGPEWDIGAYEYVSGSPDITAPTIISVTVHSPVHILFSEPLDVNSATNVQHYTIKPNTIEPNITIYSATLQQDLRTVVLTTSAHSANVEYTLTVNGVKDVAGNTMVGVIHTYQYILIANAGSDQTVTDADGNGNEQVTLDSSDSSNPNSTIVSWDWTDDLGDPIPDVEITTATLSVGTHTITLTVTDDEGFTDTDTATIIVNQAPAADAGPGQTLTDDDGNGNESVNLDGSGSTDPDGNIVSWVWTDDLGGSIPDAETTTSTLSVGTHTITLTVTDNDGATNTATVNIIVNPGNQAPTANAGTDQTLTDDDKNGSESVALDGSDSNDPDGNIVSWVWTDDLGDPIPDVEITTATLFVGTHTITLTVTDDDGATNNDTVTIIVNQAPTADAGPDQTLTDDNGNGSESVTLDGSGSTDPDGNIVSWVWTDDLGGSIPDVETTMATIAVGTHTITLTATDNDGATDTDTVSIIVNPGNQAPTANAGADQTLTDDNGNGSESVDLDGSDSNDPDGNIVSWVWTDDLGDTIPDNETTMATLAVGTHTITLMVTDDDGATDTDTVIITVNAADTTAPNVSNVSPDVNAIQVQLNTLITLNIEDAGKGVDADSVTIKVKNNTVYSGDTTKYSSAYGECYRTGTKANYTFIYQSNERFNFDQTITTTANATDLAGNSMDEYSYSFKTKMRAFGKNKKVNKNNTVNVESVDSAIINNNRPITCSDSKGNIWATWHAGPTSNKDIYVNKLTAGSEAFGNSIKLTNSTADQRNPTIAVGSDDKLYIAWQDSRRGNWDIYMSTSTDGVNWSAETRVTDSNDNKYYPAIAVDSSNNVYIVWEDSRNGNQDIYIGASNNGFVTKTISQITSDLAYQGEPAIAVDSDNTVYVVWTDKRISGENDIYGAASNNPWTNIPVVTEENNSQSSPAIATETTGSILHLVWVDDRSGDNDIFYDKTTGGLSPLTGNSIIDDTTGADQLDPVIAVIGSTANGLRVFACWSDERWLSSSGDTDIFFDEITSNSREDVFVGDDGTNTGQTEPAINIDVDGYPYLVWTDNRNMNTDIYYAGSTFIESTALASGNISTSSTVTVGTPPNAIDSVDDVSVVVPAEAYPCDIEITISKITNPLAFSMPCLGGYDFGPSNLEFSQPVTVTIPYNATESATVAYWYNSLTDSLSQQGITDFETIVVSSNLHALRFKTTHFTPFYVFLVSAGGAAASGGGGGGGGCSMSPNSQASAVELLLPYIGLTVTMVVLKLKDKRKKKARNIT